MPDLMKYLKKLVDEIDYILKVHCNFSLEELEQISWEQVETYYKKWYDETMNEKLTRMALAGVDYSDASKAKTSYYADYMKESEKNRKELTLREEYKMKLGIKEVLKRPKFLFEKEQEKVK